METVELVYNRQNGVTRSVRRDGDVVRKVLQRHGAPGQWPPSDDPRAWNYWRREALAYSTGLPERLRLPAPELLDLIETSDRIELVLRAVGPHPAPLPTIDDLVVAARLLGRAQAAPAVDDAWLSRGFLRDYAAIRPVDWSLLTDDAAWRQPLIAAHFDGRLRERVTALHERAADLIAICEALPRTVAHLDVFPANLIRDDGRLRWLDWAFTGDACLGEDIGNLVPDSIFDLFLPSDSVGELAERLPEAYLAGLADAGWAGDARLVRLGIMASVVRYEWLMPLTLRRAGDARQTSYGGVPTDTPERNYAARAAGLALCADWAEQALSLAADLRREGVAV